jgi:hypothetical protein
MCQLRRQSIGLLLQLLHVSFGEHPVTLQCWFKESAANDIMLHSPSSPMQFPASLSSWFVGENEIKNSLEKYSVAGKVSLQFLVKFLVEPQRATRTVRKSSSTTMLTAEQLKFTALGQALQLRGLTEEKGHALTVFGKALQTGMYNKHPRFTLMQMNEWREQHGELIWTVQELVRMDALNDKPLPGSVDLFSKGPAPLLLIIRVCSLLTPYFKVCVCVCVCFVIILI